MTPIASQLSLSCTRPTWIRLGLPLAILIAACGLACDLCAPVSAQETAEVESSAATVVQSPTAEVKSTTEDRKKYRFEKKGAIVFRKLRDCEVKCDVYQPESDVALPAIIMIHGGAWRQGSKLAMLRHARRMARVGYVVVSINYRLAPKYPWPAQIDDCLLYTSDAADE